MSELVVKVCVSCQESKCISKFEKRKDRPNPRSKCNACRSRERVFTPDQLLQRKKKTKEWTKNNREYLRFKEISRKYGLSRDGFDLILDSQMGSCAICLQTFKSSKDTHVDHCHSTGRVRGLLCSKCNPAIGLLGDSINVLERAIIYLNVDMSHFQIDD